MNHKKNARARRRLPRRPGQRSLPKRPVRVQPKPNNKPIEYVLNDMTTPELIRVTNTPQSTTTPNFVVKDYHGGGFPKGTPQNTAANCYMTICNTLDYYKKFFARPMKRWAGVQTLTVIPNAGKDLNAFYNRVSLQFFMFDHPKTGRLFTADSSDIVAHELGHAILDTYRPDTWSAASMEVWAYHEAFADLTAILNILSHEEILKVVIQQTEGNLKRENVASRLAEHVGRAIYQFSGPQSGRNRDCLRSAINDFKYVIPNKLPKEAPHNKLASECHSFGRVFLGAFYDILVGIYEQEKANHQPVDALRIARDAVAERTTMATLNAGLNTKFYESVAKAMLWADKTKFGNKYQEVLKRAFSERNLIQPQFMSLSSAPKCDNADGIIKTDGKVSVRLSDHFMSAQSLSNPLYDVELDIPHEQMYLYDNDNNVLDAVLVSDDDVIVAAQGVADYLHATNSVSDSPDTPFEIKNGKLIRTHFS